MAQVQCPEVTVGGKSDTFMLKPGQDIAVHRFCQFEKDTKGVFLMHNVGSGKTITSMTIALNSIKNWDDPAGADERQILVIHPTGLYPNFHKDILENFPNIQEGTCEVENGDTKKRQLKYTYTKTIESTTRSGTGARQFTVQSRDYSTIKNTFFEGQVAPTDPVKIGNFKNFFNKKIVIFDEVHRLFRTINPSGTGPTFIDIYIENNILEKAERVIFMSGTPLNKSIMDIAKMLQLVNSSVPPENLMSYDSTGPIMIHNRTVDDFDLSKKDVKQYFTHENIATTGIDFWQLITIQLTRVREFFIQVVGSQNAHPEHIFLTSKFMQKRLREIIDERYQVSYNFWNMRYLKSWISAVSTENPYLKAQDEKIMKAITTQLFPTLANRAAPRQGGGMSKQKAMEIFGIGEQYTQDELKQKYKLLALKAHPDKRVNKNNTAFKELQEAYAILLDAQGGPQDSPDSIWYTPDMVHALFGTMYDLPQLIEMVGFITSTEEFKNIEDTIPSDYFMNEMFSMSPYDYATLLQSSVAMIRFLNPVAVIKVLKTIKKDVLATVLEKENNKSIELVDKISNLHIESGDDILALQNQTTNTTLQSGGAIPLMLIIPPLVAVLNDNTEIKEILGNAVDQLKSNLPESLTPIMGPFIEGFVATTHAASIYSTVSQAVGNALKYIPGLSETIIGVTAGPITSILLTQLARIILPFILSKMTTIFSLVIDFFKYTFRPGPGGFVVDVWWGGPSQVFQRLFVTIQEVTGISFNFELSPRGFDQYLKEYKIKSDIDIYNEAVITGKMRLAAIQRIKLEKKEAFDPLNIKNFSDRASNYISVIDTTMPLINTSLYNGSRGGGTTPNVLGYKNTNLHVISEKYKLTNFPLNSEEYDQETNFIIKPKTFNYPNKIVNVIYVKYTIDQVMFFNEVESFSSLVNVKDKTKDITIKPWYMLKFDIHNAKKIASNYSKDVRQTIDNIDITANADINLVVFNSEHNNYELKLKLPHRMPTFSCPKFEKLLNYLILMKTGYMYNSDSKSEDLKDSIIRQPHLIHRPSKYNANRKPIFESINNLPPFIEQLDPTIAPTHGWLPFVYSTSDDIGLNLFGQFLTARGYKYILLHEETANDADAQKQALRTVYPLLDYSRDLNTKTFENNVISSIVHEGGSEESLEASLLPESRGGYSHIINKDFPICVLLHKFRTEGIDAKHTPAIFLLDQPENYGDYEQLCGRVMRTYSSPGYEVAPTKMVYSFVSYTHDTITELINTYDGIEANPNAITYGDRESLSLFFNMKESTIPGISTSKETGKMTTIVNMEGNAINVPETEYIPYEYLERKEALNYAAIFSIQDTLLKYKNIKIDLLTDDKVEYLKRIFSEYNKNYKNTNSEDIKIFLEKIYRILMHYKINSIIINRFSKLTYKNSVGDRKVLIDYIKIYSIFIINHTILKLISDILIPVYYTNTGDPRPNIDITVVRSIIDYIHKFNFGDDHIQTFENMKYDIDQLRHIKTVEYQFRKFVKELVGTGNPDLDAIIKYRDSLKEDEQAIVNYSPWCNEYFYNSYQNCKLDGKYKLNERQMGEIIRISNNIIDKSTVGEMRAEIQVLNDKYAEFARSVVIPPPARTSTRPRVGRRELGNLGITEDNVARAAAETAAAEAAGPPPGPPPGSPPQRVLPRGIRPPGNGTPIFSRPSGGTRHHRVSTLKSHKKRHTRQRRTRKVFYRPHRHQRKTRVYKPKSMKSLLRSRPKRTQKQFKN